MNDVRQGLTLLELLLASTIFVTLLGIVGSVTLMLMRAETTRMKQSDHQRVVRHWMQMMNDDFRSVIQDTEQLNKSEGEETIRHFGLSGTATQLRIDISRYGWQTDGMSELKTIFYDFLPTDGLVRREQDYAVRKSSPGITQTAPEIVSGRFRYYDGSAWHEYWASLDRKGSPSAVEISFYSLPFTEAERWRNQVPETEMPTFNRMVVQIPAASQSYVQSYQRQQPPKPPEEVKPPPPPSPPRVQPPPPPSPSHSFFGDE